MDIRGSHAEAYQFPAQWNHHARERDGGGFVVQRVLGVKAVVV